MLLGCAGHGFADANSDAAAVFCLAPARQQELINAASALGVITPGARTGTVVLDQREVDINEWRAQRNADFTRACSSLFAAARNAPAPAPSSALPATLTPFLSAALGVLLTLLVTSWRDKIARGRVLADGLITALGDFIRVGEEFLDGWTGPGGQPDAGLVRAERGKLVGKLGPIGVLHPKWTRIGQLRTSLVDGELGDRLTEGWARLEPDERVAKSKALKATLAGLRITSDEMARGLGRPIRSFWPAPALKAGSGS